MAKLFSLSIITSDKVLYEGKVTSLIVPAALGYLGVLVDHAPLVATLGSGKIILKEESGKTVVFNSQSRGFLEVLKNSVTMILHKND
jgi:F-type H+-transporting ATPase subunit epsilon